MKLTLALVAVGMTFGSAAFASGPSQAEIANCKAKLAAAHKAGSADLQISITNLRKPTGHVLVSVYGEKCGGFPDKNELAVANLKLTHAQAAKFVVEVPPGKYAVSILEDANDDGKMNKKMIFLPAEGFGFSNDAMEPMGPPKFSAAAVIVPAPGVKTSIKTKYY